LSISYLSQEKSCMFTFVDVRQNKIIMWFKGGHVKFRTTVAMRSHLQAATTATLYL